MLSDFMQKQHHEKKEMNETVVEVLQPGKGYAGVVDTVGANAQEQEFMGRKKRRENSKLGHVNVNVQAAIEESPLNR